MRDTFEPPSRVDEYELGRLLGRGAMGAVYLARDTLLERDVAIKFVLRHGDAVARERFLTEARAAARLDHANVVTVYRVGELEDRPYIVSEYVRGRALSVLPTPLPWRTALSIAGDLACGLAAAHRSGVLHRDIKPANAVQLDDGRVVLLDFGLAKIEIEVPPRVAVADELAAPVASDALEGDATLEPEDDDTHYDVAGGPDRVDLTRDGAVLGTPRYMAPEARRGAPSSPASDVYSLGAVVYELISGAPPEVPAAPLADRIADIDPRFAAIVGKCVESDPDDRYQSAELVWRALENVEAGRVGVDLAGSSPYRGLLPFELEHHALFYGRDGEAREVIERLRSTSLIVVAGDSGVGKSSFCRAGVLARIVNGALSAGRRWRAAEVVPGRAPLAGLAETLGLDERELDDPRAAARTVRRDLGSDDGLVLYVDQLEELVTLAAPTDGERAAAVIAALGEASESVKVVTSVRGDYLARVGGLEAFASLLGPALLLLRPLDAADLRDCIVGPAEASGAWFDSDATVEAMVAAAGDEAAALPLLQFTLSRLWDKRDRGSGEIRREHLDALGGVEGALATHADAVYLAMPTAQRDLARRILIALVTREGTRDRLTRGALPGSGASRDSVLDELVRGRLAVISEAGAEPSVHIAHEALTGSWHRLRRWLDDEQDSRRAADRVRQAARRWHERGKRREELLRGDQLRDVAVAQLADLGDDGRALVRASRRAALIRRALAALAVIAVIGALAGVWMASRIRSERARETAIAANLSSADRTLARARSASKEHGARRAEAFRQFDDGAAAANDTWAEVLELEVELRRAYAAATPPLEAALSLAPRRARLRDRLAELLLERAEVSEDLGDRDATAELLSRLEVYDDGGEHLQRWKAPAMVSLATDPAAAEITIARYGEPPGRALAGARPFRSPAELPPGSYLVRATAPGRAPTALAIVLARGERAKFELALPSLAAISPGFVYVPPGSFLYGSGEGEAQRSFYEAPPIHRRDTGGFAIAVHEITFAEWIEFLDTLPEKERDQRAPSTAGQGSGRGRIALERVGTDWILRYTPSQVEYVVAAGKLLVYRERTVRREQDWLRFPVTGMSRPDVEAYAAWLRATDRVPGARLCREDEWERAAKGADDRRFPSGDALAPGDANIDVSYGRKIGGYGADVVGSFPASRSPYGVLDAAGNVFEMTAPLHGEGIVVRGGAYFFRDATAVSANRTPLPDAIRDPTMGARLCADVTADREPAGSFGTSSPR